MMSGRRTPPPTAEQPHSGLYPLRVLSTKVLSLISSFGIFGNNSRERSKLSSILAEGSLNLQTAGKQLTPSRGRSSRKETVILHRRQIGAAATKEALWRLFPFTDGEIAGQRREKRPQPQRTALRMLIYSPRGIYKAFRTNKNG